MIKQSAHILPLDKFNKSFYINNYINWRVYYKLYNFDWKTKSIQYINKTTKIIQKTRKQRKHIEAADAKNLVQNKDSLIKKRTCGRLH